MIQRILDFVRGRLSAASRAPKSAFREGSIEELKEIEEFIEELAWEEGIDLDEEM